MGVEPAVGSHSTIHFINGTRGESQLASSTAPRQWHPWGVNAYLINGTRGYSTRCSSIAPVGSQRAPHQWYPWGFNALFVNGTRGESTRSSSKAPVGSQRSPHQWYPWESTLISSTVRLIPLCHQSLGESSSWKPTWGVTAHLINSSSSMAPVGSQQLLPWSQLSPHHCHPWVVNAHLINGIRGESTLTSSTAPEESTLTSSMVPLESQRSPQ